MGDSGLIWVIHNNIAMCKSRLNNSGGEFRVQETVTVNTRLADL